MSNGDATGTAAETVTFPTIHFTKAGTFAFTVKEDTTDTAPGGVTYDTAEFTVTYVVTDDGSGTLQIAGNQPTITRTKTGETATNPSAITFDNAYTARETTAQMSANKSVTSTGTPAYVLTDGAFRFTLKFDHYKKNANDAQATTGVWPFNGTDAMTGEHASVTLPVEVTNGSTTLGSVTFPTLTFKTAGTYIFSINEEASGIAGMTDDATTYRAIVTVTDNGKGQLVAATPVYDKGATDTNPDQSSITFNNQYDADTVKVPLTVKKNLTGAALTDSKFTFSLYTETGTEAIATVGNKGVNVTFQDLDALTFDVADFAADETTKTVNFRIEENRLTGAAEANGYVDQGMTYDPTPIYATVTLTKGNDGISYTVAYTKNGANVTSMPEFVNTYSLAPISQSLSAKKIVSGRPQLDDGTAANTPKENEFKFTVTYTDYTEATTAEAPVVQAAGEKPAIYSDAKCTTVYDWTTQTGNGAGGTVSLPAMYFTKPGIYTFKINEVVPSDADKVAGVTKRMTP